MEARALGAEPAVAQVGAVEDLLQEVYRDVVVLVGCLEADPGDLGLEFVEAMCEGDLRVEYLVEIGEERAGFVQGFCGFEGTAERDEAGLIRGAVEMDGDGFGDAFFGAEGFRLLGGGQVGKGAL